MGFFKRMNDKPKRRISKINFKEEILGKLKMVKPY